MTWRAVFYFFFGCFLGGYAAWANAGYALASPPGGMGFVPGVGYTWKPPVSTPPANGTWTAHGFVKHAGKNIPLPASWGVAANAGTFAKNALRFNPALFIGTTVAAIALDAGWEYVNDTWVVPRSENAPQPNSYWTYGSVCPLAAQCSFTEAEAAVEAELNAYYTPRSQTWSWISDWTAQNGICSQAPGGVYYVRHYSVTPGSPVWASICAYPGAPAPQPEPATEQDWHTLPVGPLTDTQLDELSRFHPQGLPVTNPVLEPVTEQIGQPYTDPVTGEQWRDMLRITPDPTASSPTRVRIDEYREPMTTPAPSPENPNPVPELDPTRNPEELPPELPLFCDWAGVVCDLYEWFTEPFDEPEAVEVPYLDDPEFDSSPLSLPSSGSCPPPQSMSLGIGNFALEFTPMCDLAFAIRPLVLAGAFLLAAFIVVGVRR